MQSFKLLIDKLENLWEDSITLKRNEFLVTPNQLNTNLYFVTNGSLRVFIEDEIEEHTIRFGYKNSIISALDCYLTGKPTSFYIQAIKQCDLQVISKKVFEDFIDSKPEYQKTWKLILEHFNYQQIEREIDLITYSPQKRFQRVFERSPQLFQEIPLKYIASYLRMTPETLSRILKKP